MRAFVSTLFAFAFTIGLAGCDRISLFSPTSIFNDGDTIVGAPDLVGPPVAPSDAAELARTTFAATRDENAGGLASSATLTWSGGGIFNLRATRASDGAVYVSPSAVGTGFSFNPDAGAGTWTVVLVEPGASKEVVLDS